MSNNDSPDLDQKPTLELDLRHLRCPLPVLRTRKALAGMKPGSRLRVTSTDPLSGIDIPHLVQQLGDRLTGQSIVDGVQVFTILKIGG